MSAFSDALTRLLHRDVVADAVVVIVVAVAVVVVVDGFACSLIFLKISNLCFHNH
jgi:hypothetical protein